MIVGSCEMICGGRGDDLQKMEDDLDMMEDDLDRMEDDLDRMKGSWPNVVGVSDKSCPKQRDSNAD